MGTLLLECALRAALVAAGTGVALGLMRIRSAAMRHGAWTAVVVTMLVLPVWAAIGPKLSLSVLHAAPQPTAWGAQAGTTAMPAPPVEPDRVFDAGAPGAPATTRSSIAWPRALMALYATGVAFLLLRLATGMALAHRLRRSATRVCGRATSERCAAPITIGWLRPTLILPLGWQHWPGDRLNLVLTHEREHARRRDPLVQSLALLNRAIFWFHPLAWWLERRLGALAEERCDAAVLEAGHSAEAYSECLIDLARSVASRGHRLRAVGMAMPGGGLRARLERIGHAPLALRTSRARLACTIVLCAASTAFFAGATLTARTTAAIDPAAVLAQAAGAIPKFDVVSVKPCDPNDRGSHGTRGGGSGRGGSSAVAVSRDRLVEHCLTLMNLIQNAYIRFADGRSHDAWGIFDTPIQGGPAWIEHDPFEIEATSIGQPSQEMMRGPMLQAVLEDRFHLKIHRETRQGPVYDLVVAAGGPKLKPADAGVCVPPDWTVFPMPPLPDGQHRCAITGGLVDASGNRIPMPPPPGPTYTLMWEDEAISLDDLAMDLLHLDRPVVNKTGLAGLFSLRLTHTFDRSDPDDGPPVGNARVAAVELKAQLGLELKSSTGPRDFLVIDHVERPTPDLPAPAPPARAAGPGGGRP
jgi:uncharacterized protein (TIGR03435 family)